MSFFLFRGTRGVRFNRDRYNRVYILFFQLGGRDGEHADDGSRRRRGRGRRHRRHHQQLQQRNTTTATTTTT